MAHPAPKAPIRPAPFPPNPLAPEVARNFAIIIGTLIAHVAHFFLRNPRHVLLIGPLCKRLNRARQRFARLMDLVAAGKRPRPHRPRPGRPTNPRPVRLPRGHAWLANALAHHGHGLASQLNHLLAQPGVPELLAAAPTASRILNPLRHSLGLSPPRPRKPRAPKPPTPKTKTERKAQRPPPRSRFAWPRSPGPRLNPSAAASHAGTASGSSTRRGTSLSPPRRTPPAG